jgi:hypothetical protein
MDFEKFKEKLVGKTFTYEGTPSTVMFKRTVIVRDDNQEVAYEVKKDTDGGFIIETELGFDPIDMKVVFADEKIGVPFNVSTNHPKHWRYLIEKQ